MRHARPPPRGRDAGGRARCGARNASFVLHDSLNIVRSSLLFLVHSLLVGGPRAPRVSESAALSDPGGPGPQPPSSAEPRPDAPAPPRATAGCRPERGGATASRSVVPKLTYRSYTATSARSAAVSYRIRAEAPFTDTPHARGHGERVASAAARRTALIRWRASVRLG